MNESKLPIEKFEGSDFGFWKMQIEDYLYGKDLHLPLGTKPANMDDSEWSVLDRKAMSVVRLSLAKNIAKNTTKAKSTVEMLKLLADTYEKPSAANKVYLMRKMLNLRMAEGMPVTSHIDEFTTIIAQLSSVEITFADEVQALVMLSSLPESWNGIVTAVSASLGKEKLKFDDVRDLLISEDIRRKELGTTSSSMLSTGNRLESSNRNRGRSDSRSHSSRGRSKSRGKGKPKDMSSVKCYNCQEFGHMRRKCPKLLKEGKSANAATEENCDALVLSVSSPLEAWVLDSGASFHSCGDRGIIENYTSGDFGVVYLADNEPLSVVGKGDVKIRSPNGTVWKLHGVRHIPGLKRNLISVGQLDGDGYVVTFGYNTWKITKGVMVVARGQKEGTLYTTVGTQDYLDIASTDGDADLWHCRLGHMSEKGMNVLSKKGRLPGLKSVEIGLCEDCIFGKQKRVSFSKGGRTPKQQRLELVHTDLWGPSPVKSLGGALYYMTFIDDSTRKVWVYFLKHKSDAFDAFKKWKALVENETNLRVKCLRSDNGGEYELKEFKEYCAKNGIRMEKPPAGTPQQNGVAERMNRTLNERARCMRLKCGLPKMFWAEAVNTATFLINRGPSTPLDFGIPEEAWSGKEVNLSFLKVFGCVAYVHVDATARSKLDAKSIKCIFIGYGGDDFGYRLWDEKNRKVIRSRDVIFDEKVLFKDRVGASEIVDRLVESTQAQNPQVVEMDISNTRTCRAVSSDQFETGDSSTPAVQSREETPNPVRRSSRVIRPPQRYSPSLHYLLLTDSGEPECYAEVLESVDLDKWTLEKLKLCIASAGLGN